MELEPKQSQEVIISVLGCSLYDHHYDYCPGAGSIWGEDIFHKIAQTKSVAASGILVDNKNGL